MEESWVERSRAGDHRAFRHLYDLHVVSLYRFLAQFSNASEDTEEWVQRAFIKSFERLHQFDNRSSFGTWLFRIGLNEMRSDIRRRKILMLEPESAAETVASADESERFAWSETLRGLLDELDEQKQSVFILYEVEGFSHREIGSMLGIDESHSRTILTRVKEHLRRGLDQERRAI